MTTGRQAIGSKALFLFWVTITVYYVFVVSAGHWWPDEVNLDPVLRMDKSYHDGHLYLYWGLLPALLLFLVKAALGIRQVVGDEVFVFAFLVGRLVMGTLLIRALATKTTAPAWAVWLAIVVFTIAYPVPYILNRGAVYEVAITGGVFFMLAGLYLVNRAAEQGSSIWWAIGASASFGLAGMSRVKEDGSPPVQMHKRGLIRV